MGEREGVARQASPPERDRLSRALACAAVIVVAAPPIGFLAYAIPFALFAAVTDGVSLEGLASFAYATMLGCVLSYMFGGIPAAICAGIVGWMIMRTGTFSYRLAAVAAVAMSLLGGLVVFGDDYAYEGAGQFAWKLGLMALIGLASALTCRYLIGRLGLLVQPSPPKSKS